MQRLPLEGIRVLDFCQMWAGPHATEWLSVMGAEVIKLESGKRIDYMRSVGAPKGLAGTGPDVGSSFASLNWGKKSITLNMTLPKSQELAKQLIKKCDVVAENFGGGVLERWGLSYKQMQELKEDIIYYAGSGYGRNGPYKERPAYAEIVDAFSGATSANGYLKGEPSVVGVSPWTDGAQAMYGAYAILAAVYYHSQTGQGQYIDAAMIEGSANFLGEAVMTNLLTGRDVERTGNQDPSMAPHGCYLCKNTKDENEWIAVAIQGQKEWNKLCRLIKNPAWTQEDRFSDELSRWKNQDPLDKHMADWTCNFGAYELAEMLQKIGIMAAPSLSTKQATNDEHLNKRGFFIHTEHPVLGKVTLTGLPLRINNKSAGNYTRAPLLGEDNKYVFSDLLGLSLEEIESLSREKVIS